MLSEEAFVLWAQSLNLSSQATAEIERVRHSPPSRLVDSKAGNVSGKYPSRKMGVYLQFESHRLELAIMYELEHDPDVLEYYDQPPPIKLNYLTKSGKRQGVSHTPDFFVLRRDSAGWEECKTEKDFLRLADQMPQRYVHMEGQWRCPPGENYAQQFGLYYRFRSSIQIDWIYQRNIQFLDPYLRADALLVDDQCREIIWSCLEEKNFIVLSDLLAKVKGEELYVDTIYVLIAMGELCVDLSAAPLAEPRRVQVFRDQESANAYRKMVNLSTQRPDHSALFIDLTEGARLSWDGKDRTIINIGTSTVTILGGDGSPIDLPFAVLEDYVRQGKITGSPPQIESKHSAGAGRLMAQAAPDAIQEANRRYEVILPHLQGGGGDFGSVPERTAWRWLAEYRKAEQLYGCGYLGLIPHQRQRGNRCCRLPAEMREAMISFIDKHYETLKQQSKSIVHALFKKEYESSGLPLPSYKAFVQEVNRRPRYVQVKKRQGERAAYKFEKWFWELELTTPRHGDRPFEILHIDHTLIDVEVVHSLTGRNMGRLWVTFLIDAFSRRLLAFALSFDRPSYRSCMMVLRECIKRHSRLPQILVVDGGAEFSSIYFEKLLAYYEITKKKRPGAKPRFGSVCERLFGVANTQFIHNLAGNTKNMKNVREVTKAVNPKTHAIWTFERLYERMAEWAYEVYDTNVHPALGQSPREAYAQGILQSGSRSHRLIPYDDNFIISTLPAPTREKSKVLPGKGVKINHIYYWSEMFLDPEVEKTRVPVRYDPYDASRAYAYVGGQWVGCISEHSAAFEGRSEKEIKIATEELRQQLKQYSNRSDITARKLADFVTSVEAEELEALAVQRMRDAEAQTISKIKEGGRRASAKIEKSTEECRRQTKENNPDQVGDKTEEFEIEVYGRF